MADEVEPVIGHQDLPYDNHEAGHGRLRQRVIGLPVAMPSVHCRTPNIYISPRVAVVALSSTDQPVRGGLSAIRYRRSRAALPRFLPSRSWGVGRPATGSRRGTC